MDVGLAVMLRERFEIVRGRWAMARERLAMAPLRMWILLLLAALAVSIVIASGLGAARIPVTEIPFALADVDHPGHHARAVPPPPTPRRRDCTGKA